VTGGRIIADGVYLDLPEDAALRVLGAVEGDLIIALSCLAKSGTAKAVR